MIEVPYLFAESLDLMLRDGLEINELFNLAIEDGDVFVVQNVEHGSKWNLNERECLLPFLNNYIYLFLC